MLYIIGMALMMWAVLIHWLIGELVDYKTKYLLPSLVLSTMIMSLGAAVFLSAGG